MTALSERILADYQVRKTNAQKQAYLEFMRAYIPEIKTEITHLPRTTNMIIGDVQKASIILSAHYDTCAQMPVPNFITPLNPLLSILYSVILVIPMFLVVFLLNFLLNFLTDDFWIHYCVSLAVLCTFMAFMIAGPANKHTVNDNTSGVIALCEIYSKLSAEDREKVAFVFFDNEEKGLIGSAAFRKKHKKLLDHKLLINFDCISDGDHLLLAVNKKARCKYNELLAQAFQTKDVKNVSLKNAEKVYYPSDQAGFPMSVAVAAMQHNKHIGYYMDKIHTKKDTVMDFSNISFICDGIIKLVHLI